MTAANTLCNMCSHQCGMRLDIEGGRIVRVEGEPENPISVGKLCAKGLSAAQLEYDPHRLLHPLRRAGERGSGEWIRITWDEAFDLITTRLKEIVREHGPEAIAWHRGTAPRWGTNWALVQRFMNVLGSPNLSTLDNLCHTPRVIGHAHTYGAAPIPDYEGARCILIWGFNPAETSVPVTMRRIMEAKRRGAQLIVIDPRFSKTAAKADLYVRLRPGTDGALAFGMLNVIIGEGLYDREFVERWTVGFEELARMADRYPPERVEAITGVPAGMVREVARSYATLRPAVLEEGNGLDQHTNVVQTVRAVAALRAVTGNLGVPGGHIFQPSLGLKDISLRGRIENAYAKSASTIPVYYNEPHIGLLTTPELVDAIHTEKPYPIRALIVEASAIELISSNTERVREALRRLDLIVVHDLFMSSTAEGADLVLPATTFLEHSLLITQPGPGAEAITLGLMNRCVEPPGEGLSDPEFIIELAKRMGFGEEFPWRGPDEMYDEILRPRGLTVEELRRHPGGLLVSFDPADIYKSYEKKGFKTPSGKVELYSRSLEQHGYDPLPDYREPAESPLSDPATFAKYPLVCGTGLKPGVYTHTRYRSLPWLNELAPEPYTLINPIDAEALGVVDGERVVVESPRGRIEVRAKVSEEIGRGVVLVAHGWGHPHSGGAVANVLTDDARRDSISGSTGNRSFLCRVSKIEGSG